MKHLLSIPLFLFLFFSCTDITERKEEYEVHGIDVSHYQSYINWDSIARQDISFVFIKASEGDDFLDTLFCNNWESLRNTNIKRGAYHFFRPTLPADQQVINFYSQVDLYPGDLAPVLDVEVLDGVSKETLIKGMDYWLQSIEEKYGIRPFIYTNLDFYNKHLSGHFDTYPLWIARYSNRKPNLYSGRDWQFWQYGNKGRLAGINGDVDFNVFNGSPEALDNYCLKDNTLILSSLARVGE